MTKQLDLPLRKPAAPLPPLALDGACQAARMRTLEDIAECRFDLGLSRDHVRHVGPSPILLLNHRRYCGLCLRDARQRAAEMPA